VFESVDVKKILEQDDDFREFAKEALLVNMLMLPESRQFISALYSFYNIGMTKEQVIQWIKTASNLGLDKRDEPDEEWSV
jgi:hypothetical protein